MFQVLNLDGSVAREFGRKSDAARYANKHGLTAIVDRRETVSDAQLDCDANTIAISDALAVLDQVEAIDDVSTDDVLAVLDASDESETVESAPTLREIANGFSDAQVIDMVERINASLARRDTFESLNGLCIASDNSYTRERDRMVKSSVAVARFFLALGLEPSTVIERKVASSAMFNAKALKKVTELAQYTCGFGQRLERVTRAFIACALIATDRGVSVITNETNRKFLCSVGFSGQVTDQDLIDNLDEMRLRSMSSGAETQSSQARNVLDVLGLGAIMTVQRARDAITLDRDHAFFTQFRADFMR